jgi:uncharacterized protein YaiI (UPF0178 family)
VSLKIWVDADACPKDVKEVVLKASLRFQTPVIFVANQFLRLPHDELVKMIQVEAGADVADQYIVDHCESGDLVITADVPLAGKIIEKQAIGLDHRGEFFDEESISDRLSMRNFMQDLRDQGTVTGGPNSYGQKDKILFTNSLDRFLQKQKKDNQKT